MKPTIALIGAGNVATHLAKALTRASYTITGVYSRTLEHARRVAEPAGAAATDQLSALAAADVYIFAVTDTALPALVKAMPTAARKGFFLHTAGSVPMEVPTAAPQPSSAAHALPKTTSASKPTVPSTS